MSEFLVGQLVVVTDVITSGTSGALVDDVTDAMTVYKPDGTNAAITLTQVGAPGSGTYSGTYTFDQPLWHEFVATSTATGAGKGRTRVYVSPVP